MQSKQSNAPILYEEILVSSWYRKVGTIGVGILSAGIILFIASGISSTLFYEEERWVLLVIAAFVILCLFHLGIYVKDVLVHGRIIVTSEGLILRQGRQEVSFPRTDLVQYERKRLYPGSKNAPAHVLREEGDVMKGFISCQIFPDIFPDKMRIFHPEAVFLVTKRTTPSWGGLFGRRILVDLPFFIPTNHPDRLLSALEKISPLGDRGFRA